MNRGDLVEFHGQLYSLISREEQDKYWKCAGWRVSAASADASMPGYSSFIPDYMSSRKAPLDWEPVVGTGGKLFMRWEYQAGSYVKCYRRVES